MIDYAALTRMILYTLAAGGGVTVLVIGAVRGDLELVGAGAGLLGTGGLAVANTDVTYTGRHAE